MGWIHCLKNEKYIEAVNANEIIDILIDEQNYISALQSNEEMDVVEKYSIWNMKSYLSNWIGIVEIHAQKINVHKENMKQLKDIWKQYYQIKNNWTKTNVELICKMIEGYQQEMSEKSKC